MADVVLQICDFHTKSKSAGKLIDKQSMQNVINSQKFKEDLQKGNILSLFTHKDRYNLNDQNIPFEDNVLTSPYLCAVARKVWIDETKDAAFGELDLLDTTYGRLWKDLLKKGFMNSTSMSVTAHVSPDGSKYIIDGILSIADPTARPDLNAGVISVSFSEKRLGVKGVYNFSSGTSNTIKCNFDMNSPCESDPELLKKYLAEFSETETSRPEQTLPENDKLDVQAAKPVENTKVPTDTSVITNLDAGLPAGVDTESITSAATNQASEREFPVTVKVDGDDAVEVSTPKDLNTLTAVFSALGKKFEIVSGTIEGAKQFSVDDTFDPSGTIQTTTDDNTPELDTSDMEKIHEDIPVEDQLTEQQLIQLPTQISSTVNASQAGIAHIAEFGKKYRVFSFNGKSQDISKESLNELLTSNFSEGSLVGHEFANDKKKFYVSNFSANKYLVQFNTGNTYRVTSEKLLNLIKTKNYSDISNFTVQSYLQELHMQPYQVLRRRINEVIQICRGWKQDKIHNSIENLKAYFDSYILTWITRILNDPSQEFNIILGLRLQNFRVDAKKMRDLNRCIKRMRTQLNSSGFMNKQIQNELNAYFQAIENDLYEYINTELSKSGKYFK